MKKIVLKSYGKLIAWLLTLVGGMQACEITEPRVEYGMPTADYVIKGSVTDQATKKPIGNINVISKSRYSPYGNDTVKTNANGEYEFEYNRILTDQFAIFAEDVDGDANGGTFAPDSIKFTPSEMKRTKKGKNWYDGAFEKEVNFTLKQKTDTSADPQP